MERKKKEKIMHIPDEIVFSILGRLPPKSLVRFKCIWKSWESFVNQYKYHNQKLIVLTDTSIQSIDFEADEIEAVDLHIPFKGRYNRVTPSSPLGYNIFGFWYDHSTSNYMIVRFVDFDDDNERPPTSGFLVNEALYWEISYKNEHYKGCNGVLCYDTLQSKFDVFLPPDNVDVFDILGNIKGRLCYDTSQKRPVREQRIFSGLQRRKQFFFYSPARETYKIFQIPNISLNFDEEITYTESIVSP
ncbi:hypothetical protein ACOSQ3_007700 [Xanthoceras sorbifolium]